MDDIEKRSQTLLEKGKVARVLDKEQEAQAVVRLIDQLQKTILIYQVCTGGCRVSAGLTRSMADVPTAVDPQPGHTIDGKLVQDIFGVG